MLNNRILVILLTCLLLISCAQNNPNPLINDSTPNQFLIGTWVNVVDTVWTMDVNLYDTNYTPQKPSKYWDTITFIDSIRCITGVAVKDTQTYWFEDSLSTKWIIIRGLEDHTWMAQTAFPFEIKGSCISMKPYIYSKL